MANGEWQHAVVGYPRGVWYPHAPVVFVISNRYIQKCGAPSFEWNLRILSTNYLVIGLYLSQNNYLHTRIPM
jgi:hypothetical protein